MISDVNGSIITELGSYHLLGSELNMAGIVHYDISSGLLRDEEYYLNVTLATFTYMSMSDGYCFGIVNLHTCIAMHIIVIFFPSMHVGATTPP